MLNFLNMLKEIRGIIRRSGNGVGKELSIETKKEKYICIGKLDFTKLKNAILWKTILTK